MGSPKKSAVAAKKKSNHTKAALTNAHSSSLAGVITPFLHMFVCLFLLVPSRTFSESRGDITG